MRITTASSGRAPTADARSRNSRAAGDSELDVASGATLQTCSPSTASRSRLVVRMRAAGPPARMRSTVSATPSMTCSALSSTISRSRAPTSASSSAAGLPCGGQAQRGDHDVGDGRGILDRCELDDACAELEAIRRSAGDLECETGLADTTRAGERDEAGALEQLDDERRCRRRARRTMTGRWADETDVVWPAVAVARLTLGRRVASPLSATRSASRSRLRRFQPDLGQCIRRPPEGAQCFGAAVGVGERLDQHRPAALAQRFDRDERLGGGHRLVDPAGPQQCGGVGLSQPRRVAPPGGGPRDGPARRRRGRRTPAPSTGRGRRRARLRPRRGRQGGPRRRGCRSVRRRARRRSMSSAKPPPRLASAVPRWARRRET